MQKTVLLLCGLYHRATRHIALQGQFACKAYQLATDADVGTHRFAYCSENLRITSNAWDASLFAAGTAAVDGPGTQHVQWNCQEIRGRTGGMGQGSSVS